MVSGSRGGLQGVGVVVTRGEGEDGPLTRLLKAAGATVLDWGTVGVAPPEDLCPFYSALIRIRAYDWICFSSPRAVDAVVTRSPIPPPGVRIAAVGPSTAAALERAGWPVDRVPDVGSGEALVETFREAGDVSGSRVFFPASAIAREVIPIGLTQLGADVDQRTAYRMVTLALDSEACRSSLEAGAVQVVTFASPSAMKGLEEALGADLFQTLAQGTPAAVMGPTTAGALSNAGWRKVAVAEDPSWEGLVDAAREAATL
jgi:uroporphyrinogen III methyltransferase/synthase